jgi:hypothetical protein
MLKQKPRGLWLRLRSLFATSLDFQGVTAHLEKQHPVVHSDDNFYSIFG